jgi:hypothetical protein
MAGKKQSEKSGSISIHFSGNNNGQVAVGNHNTQTQITLTSSELVTEADLSQVELLLAQLKEEVAKKAPPAQQQDALTRVEDLAEAIKKPSEEEVSTMVYVKKWFVNNLPSVAGAVTSLIGSPIVGKLVQAAGDAAVAEFKRRFPGEAG